MQLILHRVNTINLLKVTPRELGVEIDIRSSDGNLIIHHEPFSKGQNLEEWLSEFQHGTLILNVKEEGLEEPVLRLMEKYNINDFFFS